MAGALPRIRTLGGSRWQRGRRCLCLLPATVLPAAGYPDGDRRNTIRRARLGDAGGGAVGQTLCTADSVQAHSAVGSIGGILAARGQISLVAIPVLLWGSLQFLCVLIRTTNRLWRFRLLIIGGGYH